MTQHRAQPIARLVDANPARVTIGPRVGVGIAFDCPIHEDCRIALPTTPFDGKPPISWLPNNNVWERTGDDFGTMSLAPSINVLGDGVHDCNWHGFIRNGRFE